LNLGIKANELHCAHLEFERSLGFDFWVRLFVVGLGPTDPDRQRGL
jgi:hypothetical protein